MVEEEVAGPERVPLVATPEAMRRAKGRPKTMIIGFGAILVILGIALAAYEASHEGEAIIIALGPAFIGVMIIIAALFGKKL